MSENQGAKKRSRLGVEHHLIIRQVLVCGYCATFCLISHSSAFLWSLINFMAFHLSDVEAELRDKEDPTHGSGTVCTCWKKPTGRRWMDALAPMTALAPISGTDRITRRGGISDCTQDCQCGLIAKPFAKTRPTIS